MAFAERYAAALPRSLKDDEHHHGTEVLAAAAIADRSARNIGALLHRVKYGNSMKKTFEGDSHALVVLQNAWLLIVTIKGRERKWIKDKDWPNIGHLLPAMAARIASHSLAQYLDGLCEPCGGRGTLGPQAAYRTCPDCGGSKRGKIIGLDRYETGLAEGLVGELEVLESSHAGVASVLLRRGE